MIAGPIAIVKVGGSLLDWPELPRRLTEFLEAQRRREPGIRPILLCGGGPFAEAVRHLDRVHRLGDLAAHRLAIRSMDLASDVLGRLLCGVRKINRLADVDHSARAEFPMLVPSRILEEMEENDPDPLPCSWDVTSDSIAAWIADRLRARSLVLLKSAPIPEEASRETAARLGLVDPFFPRVSKDVDRVEYVNLRHPTTRCIELRRSEDAPP